jgi:2-(1,2-epoxy-1,2-dihydrophenyl)acetyl-CoA isomerase
VSATARPPGAGTAEPVVLLDEPVPLVVRLRINRPDKRNAIDTAVRQALLDHFEALRPGGRARAIVLGGAGGFFSAGGDLPSMIGLDESQARERMRHVHRLCRMVAETGLPVVSAIEGAAAGAGAGLALLGDRIVVGPGSRLLFPFLGIGLAPDWGQLHTLPRRVGLPVAQRLLCDGAPVGGEEAVRIGLADLLVPDDAVMPEAIALAARLARLPADAYGRMKRRLRQPSASLAEELGREEDDQAVLLLAEDFREGFEAFRAKRPADFVRRHEASGP